tara:strand:- start:44955 stop:45074 length:120 start_codon:yes stop_codon:yes gene_type:complete
MHLPLPQIQYNIMIISIPLGMSITGRLKKHRSTVVSETR